MDNSQIQIRRLTPSECAAYREIRLEALRLNPESFGSTLEAESARPLEHFSERVAGCPVFGAFRDAQMVARAGFLVAKARRMRTRGTSGGCMSGLARGMPAWGGSLQKR